MPEHAARQIPIAHKLVNRYMAEQCFVAALDLIHSPNFTERRLLNSYLAVLNNERVQESILSETELNELNPSFTDPIYSDGTSEEKAAIEYFGLAPKKPQPA